MEMITQVVEKMIDGVSTEITINHIVTLRNRAFIKELIAYNPDINVDRIRAFGMCMIIREDRMIVTNGTFRVNDNSDDKTYLGNDDFFSKNYITSTVGK